jgi:general secretion pathway protein C
MSMVALAPLLALLVAPPLDLQVVGVVVSGDPLRSVAMLRAAGRTRLAAVGESAFGGRVALVGRESVTVEFDGQKVELRLTAGVVRASDPPPKPMAAAPRLESAPPGARAMERREVERRLGQEVPRILAETTAVPVMDDGRVAGLALTRIPESSLLTDAGLQAGDVLTEVNGTPVDSLASLMALYPKLQTQSELQAVVLRNGQPVRISVTLR